MKFKEYLKINEAKIGPLTVALMRHWGEVMRTRQGKELERHMEDLFGTTEIGDDALANAYDAFWKTLNDYEKKMK